MMSKKFETLVLESVQNNLEKVAKETNQSVEELKTGLMAVLTEASRSLSLAKEVANKKCFDITLNILGIRIRLKGCIETLSNEQYRICLKIWFSGLLVFDHCFLLVLGGFIRHEINLGLVGASIEIGLRRSGNSICLYAKGSIWAVGIGKESFDINLICI